MFGAQKSTTENSVGEIFICSNLSTDSMYTLKDGIGTQSSILEKKIERCS
jgi:hypothetical protein